MQMVIQGRLVLLSELIVCRAGSSVSEMGAEIGTQQWSV